jgi:hypothetical protein
MSWSLEVFSTRSQRLTTEELAARLTIVAPSLSIQAEGLAPIGDDKKDWARLQVKTSETPLAHIVATPFDDEQEADPELIFVLEQEITESDAAVDAMDEKFTSQLKHLLRTSCWHYIVSVDENDVPAHEWATIRTAYAISQIENGLVHDLQSGAWMDAELFEGLLDAYGANTAL